MPRFEPMVPDAEVNYLLSLKYQSFKTLLHKGDQLDEWFSNFLTLICSKKFILCNDNDPGNTHPPHTDSHTCTHTHTRTHTHRHTDTHTHTDRYAHTHISIPPYKNMQLKQKLLKTIIALSICFYSTYILL